MLLDVVVNSKIKFKFVCLVTAIYYLKKILIILQKMIIRFHVVLAFNNGGVQIKHRIVLATNFVLILIV